MAPSAEMQAIAQQLAASNQRFYQQDPFINAAQSMQPIQVAPWQKNDPWQAAAIGLQGVARGFLQGYGINNAREQQGQYASGIANALQKPGGVYELAKDPMYGDIAPQLMLQDYGAKQENNAELKKNWATALFQANTPQQRQQILSLGQQMGFIEGDALQVPNTYGGAPKPEPSVLDMGPDLGVPTLRDVEKTTFNENLDTGMPPTQAGASSRAAAEDMRKRSRDLFGNQLADSADTVAKLEDLTAKGREGIDTAGDTGSTLASMYEKALSYFPNAFPEAARQASGDKLLELTQNIGASLNRIKGSGALSDFESKALFKTAMSPSNTVPQNEAVLRGYENALAIAREHQSFMNYFMDKTGGNPQLAQQYWDNYKAQNPILVRDGQGKYVPNPTRTPWQQFDFVGAQKNFLTGGTPQQQAPQAPLAPSAVGPNPESDQKAAFLQQNMGGAPPMAPAAPQPQQPPTQQPTYTPEQLQAAGYSPQDIAALRQQGLIP